MSDEWLGKVSTGLETMWRRVCIRM